MLIRDYAKSIYFDQYGLVQVFEDHVLDRHLVWPALSDINKPVDLRDMIDVRTGKSVVDTAHMLKVHLQHCIYESLRQNTLLKRLR